MDQLKDSVYCYYGKAVSCFLMEVIQLSGVNIFQFSADSKLITITVLNNNSILEHTHKKFELINMVLF